MEDALKSAVSSRFVLVQPTCLQFHILAISSAIVIRECWEWPKIDFYIPDSSTAFENHYWTGTRVLVYREGSRKNLDSLGLIIIRWVNEVQRLEAPAQILLTPKAVFSFPFYFRCWVAWQQQGSSNHGASSDRDWSAAFKAHRCTARLLCGPSPEIANVCK